MVLTVTLLALIDPPARAATFTAVTVTLGVPENAGVKVIV